MKPLPFALRVPGEDDVEGVEVRSTAYKFHGLLRFEGTVVQLEWTGTASVDEVTGLGVHSRTISLPEESLDVSVNDLRRVELRGGWWRPRLELAAQRVETLRSVPGEDGGQVRLWIARRDRATARALAATITAAMEHPSLTDTGDHQPPGQRVARSREESP